MTASATATTATNQHIQKIAALGERYRRENLCAPYLQTNSLEKNVAIVDDRDGEHRVFTYVADAAYIEPDLPPYSWYTRFVIEGARQHDLPADYIAEIEAVPDTEDPDKKRDAENRAIQCG
jgi:hypothetical protein